LLPDDVFTFTPLLGVDGDVLAHDVAGTVQPFNDDGQHQDAVRGVHDGHLDNHAGHYLLVKVLDQVGLLVHVGRDPPAGDDQNGQSNQEEGQVDDEARFGFVEVDEGGHASEHEPHHEHVAQHVEHRHRDCLSDGEVLDASYLGAVRCCYVLLSCVHRILRL